MFVRWAVELRILGRPFDGITQLFARKPRWQKLRTVDCLGQIAEGVAVAQEIRSHRQRHVDARMLHSGGREQQIDKRNRIVQSFGIDFLVMRNRVPVAVREAENLLELINQNQHVRLLTRQEAVDGVQ